MMITHAKNHGSLFSNFNWKTFSLPQKALYITAGAMTLLGVGFLLYRLHNVYQNQTIHKSMTERKIIVFTDLEPDDRRALDVLISAFTQDHILLIGTTVMNAARKKALIRKLLDQLGLENVPVYQGTGGTADEYPVVNSTKAAKSYSHEGENILTEEELESLSSMSHSSNELQENVRMALEAAEDHSIEVAMLAPPTDLVKVLTDFPHLQKKIKHIYVMGGWAEIPQKEGEPICRSTYNWDMDLSASAQLMDMRNIPMTLHSSHVLKRAFNGGGVNSKNFPALIEKINACQSLLPHLKDASTASISWNRHVMETIPVLKDVIGEYVEHQFTPADPAVVVGMINTDFVLKKKQVRIEIDLEEQSGRGCIVKVSEDPSSEISLVEEIDLHIFEQEMISAYDRLLEKVPNKN